MVTKINYRICFWSSKFRQNSTSVQHNMLVKKKCNNVVSALNIHKNNDLLEISLNELFRKERESDK